MPSKKTNHKPSLIGKIQKSKSKKKDIVILGRKKFFDLRPTDLARIKAGIELEGKDPIEIGQLGFSTRPLVQANLPHSKPKKKDESFWVRRNGNFTLSIQSDVTVNPKTGEQELIGIPYGTVPRLILFYLCSEAVRTKSRTISLGDNLSVFLRELGLQPTGGKKGDITRFKNQMRRLVTAKIKFQCTTDSAEASVNASIAKRHLFFWDKDPLQSSLFESQIVLDSDFYDEIIAAPVPIHLGAVSALKSSSFGLDLYTWLTYRVSNLRNPVRVSWDDLREQLGADYGSTKEFARRARKVLSEVKSVWKSLDIDTVRGGILIKPCEPSIPRKKRIE